MTMSATKEKKHIDQLHFEHKLWISSLRLYIDELVIFQHRLGEVSEKNTSPEIRKEIEHFQNQFIVQKEQLDILRHRINEHERSLAHYAQKHPVAVDHVLFDDHAALRDARETFDRLFNEHKTEFISFLDKWL